MGKVRHIEICQLWLQEKVSNGDIVVEKVDTKENVADALTKHVSREDLEKHMMLTSQANSIADASEPSGSSRDSIWAKICARAGPGSE